MIDTVRRLLSSAASDESLIAKVSRGDAHALEQLYQRFSGRVLATAKRVLGSASEAEEVVQETFIEVWNNAHSFDAARGSAAAWLTRIGRNRAIDRLRAVGSRRRTLGGFQTTADLVPSGTTPEQALAQAQSNVRVAKALELLPPEQRVVIELAYFGGLSQTEIAERTGAALGTIKGRARAGLEKLAETLAKEPA